MDTSEIEPLQDEWLSSHKPEVCEAVEEPVDGYIRW
jgi:hypothetical protein